MNENEVKNLRNLQSEIDDIAYELGIMSIKGFADITPEDENRYWELKERISEVENRARVILNDLNASQKRFDSINAERQLHPKVTIEEIEVEPGEYKRLEDRIKTIEETQISLRMKVLDSIERQAHEQFVATKEIRESKFRKIRLEEKSKAVQELFATTDPNPQVLLMESCTTRFDDYQCKSESSTMRTPISAAAVRLLEITGASRAYNYEDYIIVGINYDRIGKRRETTYLTEQELIGKKDYDGVNAVRLYKEKVAEVATDPKYQREVVLKIPIYTDSKKEFKESIKPEYVEFRCLESELAQRLGMLPMDLLPEISYKGKSATDYFKEASASYRVEKLIPSLQKEEETPSPVKSESAPSSKEPIEVPKKKSGFRKLMEAFKGNRGK